MRTIGTISLAAFLLVAISCGPEPADDFEQIARDAVDELRKSNDTLRKAVGRIKQLEADLRQCRGEIQVEEEAK